MNTDTKELKKEYYSARKALERLEAELPNYEALLADNERAEQERRRIKAPLDELALAKTRVQAARELLEQHHADIDAARGEVARLEADYQHAQTLDRMAESAKEAERQRDTFEATMLEANKVLTPLVEKLDAAWLGLNQARRDFLSAGRSLSEGFGRNAWPWGATGEQMREAEAKLTAVLNEVKARGVTLDAALTPHDGRRASMADLEHGKRLVPPEPWGNLLVRAMRLREEALPPGAVAVKDSPRVLDSTTLGLGRQVQEEMKGVKHE